MNARSLVMAGLMAFASMSCATVLPPVSVIATRPDAMALAGSWVGEYYSADTRRHGTIEFFLSADPDSAAGDVLMLPRRALRYVDGNDYRPSAAAEVPQHIAIRLVMADRDTVVGVLEPYEDYDGSVLLTRFTGLLRDDRITGRYTTRNVRTQDVTGGEWSLRRRKP
jgi:hypothetical protein